MFCTKTHVLYSSILFYRQTYYTQKLTVMLPQIECQGTGNTA